MPTKDFRAHLQQAMRVGQWTHISDVKPGDLDFSISITFTAHSAIDNSRLEFLLVVSDAHDYPENHSFLVTCSGDGPTALLVDAIEKCQEPHRFFGFTINEVLIAIEGLLSPPSPRSDCFPACDDTSGFEVDSECVNFHLFTSNLHEILYRDLEAARSAGFRVGYIGQVTGPLIISMSCHMSQLDLSPETLRAWNIDPSHHLALLIRFLGSYRTMHQIFEGNDPALCDIEMRFGLCEYYFPHPQAARDMFVADSEKILKDHDRLSIYEQESPVLKDLFISSSLHHLLNTRFLAIARMRNRFNLTWTGAEIFCHEMQGKPVNSLEPKEKRYWTPDAWPTPVTSLLACDHFVSARMDGDFISLPLLAMQYTLRHFVNCPKFCLVCHCRTFDEFESLKPYVCSRGLCLFQYIELGLGSSIEFEIRSNPIVVDLLVSLAYESAAAYSLASFPTGLRLKVPPINPQIVGPSGAPVIPIGTKKALLDRERMVLSGPDVQNVSLGTWIVIPNAEPSVSWHCQVTPGVSASSVHLSGPIKVADKLFSPGMHGMVQSPAELPEKALASNLKVEFLLYDQDFDDLSNHQKQVAVQLLLNTLPSIQSIAELLDRLGSLGLWGSFYRIISPASFALLRWIVASNRSYITHETSVPDTYKNFMNTHLAFRFVHGSPDREQRFFQAVKTHAAKVQPTTLSVWHGSAISNWHNILRQGLNFQKVSHGRSCGDGVYFAQNFQTSLQYSTGSVAHWPQSNLKMTYVISLNDVVNCPKKFVCSNPHYVVQYVDWIQTRYLLIGQGAQGQNVAASYAATNPAFPFLSVSPDVSKGTQSKLLPEEAEKKKRKRQGRKKKTRSCYDEQELDAEWNSSFSSKKSET